MTSTSNWEELAKAKKAEVDATIPKEWLLPAEIHDKYNESTPESVLHIPKQLLSERELEITENYNVPQLVEQITSTKYTAVEVLNAFSHRAAIATQLTNCCTELLFHYALERAKFLDNYLKENKKPFGPLHGVPISVKDLFNIPGYDSTLGFVSLIGNKATKESDFVRLLLDLGAVVFVKTNIPQTLMTADSENNIFGRTLNPLNLTWTAGGSSGGEGALIKLRGSIAGIGTDVGGSIRIPALCNGVYGFRPSTFRFPLGNQAECSREVYVDIVSVSGPLAADIVSLDYVTKAIFKQKPWEYDVSLYRLKYQEPELNPNSKLRIGVIFEDSDFPVHPPIKRIIKEAILKLTEAGHSVTFIESFPSYNAGFKLAMASFLTDTNGTALKKIHASGERIIKSLTLPILDVYGEIPQNVDELIQHKDKVQKYANDWTNVFKNYDVIIAPGAPGTAPPHDDYGIAPYTTIWNLVDFPASIIPFGQADAKIDVDDNAKYPAELDNIYAHYQPEVYDKGIGHVQVIAPKLEDETLLVATTIIDKVLNA
jgi:amidase